MKIGVAILFEGRFAEGAAAFVNSLFRWGYRGTVYCGTRGKVPEWLRGDAPREPAPGLELMSVPVEYGGALTWSKPRFVLDLWSGVGRECEVLYYFDADIVLIGTWQIFETWAADGLAVCADVNPEMPPGHPFRKVWRELLDPSDRLSERPLGTYYNAGFFGLPRPWQGFLERWKSCNETFSKQLSEVARQGGGRIRHPLSALDQDAFNAALMLSDVPLRSMGQDGMGFQSGGGNYVMAHPVGESKPWSTSMIGQALRRRRPTLAARAFVANLAGPVEVYSPIRRWLYRMDLALARALGAAIGT